jgi:hypothetical protein
VLHRDLDRRIAAERHLPSQHLVEDDSDRVQVGGGGHRRPASLFRRQVLRRPHDRAGLRHLGRPRARDAEVRHLQPLADQDVVRLDIAVDDSVAMREAKRFEHLERVRDRMADGQRTAREDQLLQAPALDDLHGDVVRPLGLAAVVDRDDVGMREARGGLRLATEALDEELVVRVAVVQDLDRHAPAEVLVLGQIDVGHPARAELAQDAVAPVEERVDQGVGDSHLRFRLGISL